MKIFIGGKEIISRDISQFETAWPIEEAGAVIEYLKSNNKLIYGGDILTDKLVYAYDNWYYNKDAAIDAQENIARSAEKAQDYIAKYIKFNGTAFYVVFVTD